MTSFILLAPSTTQVCVTERKEMVVVVVGGGGGGGGVGDPELFFSHQHISQQVI